MTDAAEKKAVATVLVLFSERFKARVEVQAQEEDVLARERDLVQLFSLTLVKVLFLLGENQQAPMLLQYVQAVMGDTVNPKGLHRPSILGQGQELLERTPETMDRTMTLRLVQEEDGRLADLSLALGDEGHYYPTTVVFFLQHLIRTLGDPSLFFLMLVLGGVMEYYEGIGKTDDLKALTDAPAYGFSTAVKYIEEERKRSQGSVD